MYKRIFTAGAALLPLLAGAQDRAQRPDIVFLFADDWGFPFARDYGDQNVDSYLFDRIADEGMVFTNAYCTAPSSSPSRASILTGRYPHNLRQAANLWGIFPSDLVCYPARLQENGYVSAYQGKGWGPGLWLLEKGNPAGEQVKDLAAWIRSTPADQPICAWLGSHRPHRPYVEGSGVEHGFSTSAVLVSENLPDVEEVRGDMADYYWNIRLFQDECMDVMRALEETGRLENTLLVIAGDNGYPFPRAKSNVYDEGCHVPLAIRWPGVTKPKSRCEGFVSLMDLTATFYEASGVTPPDSLQSVSLIPTLLGKADGRPEIFTEKERHVPRRDGTGYPSRSLRDKKFQYIRNFHPERTSQGEDPIYGEVDNGPAKKYMVEHARETHPELYDLAFGPRPAEELYDVVNDPWLKHNLASDPAYRKVLRKMSRKMDRWMKESYDPRYRNPGYVATDRYRYMNNRRVLEQAINTDNWE